MKFYPIFLLTFVLVLSSGCNFLKRNTIDLFDSKQPTESEQLTASDTTSEETIEPESKPFKLNPTPDTQISSGQGLSTADVELIWRIPEEEVDLFIINLGYSRELLNQEFNINPAEAEQIEHPKYGPVYRYIIKDQPKDKAIFVTISSVKDTHVSAPSPVMEVPR